MIWFLIGAALGWVVAVTLQRRRARAEGQRETIVVVQGVEAWRRMLASLGTRRGRYDGN